jgi:hypothetical protein
MIAEHMKKILVFVTLVVTALAIWKLDKIISLAEIVYSVISKDVIGELLPYQHKITSSFQKDDFQLKVVCSRNIFTYSIYMYTEIAGQPNEFVTLATKDAIQDCNEYNIENVIWNEDSSQYSIRFRNDSNILIDARR